MWFIAIFSFQPLTPAFNLKKNDNRPAAVIAAVPVGPSSDQNDMEWDFQDEYEPLKPNDYEKIMKERREKAADDMKRTRDRKRRQPEPSGFAARPASEDEEEYKKPTSNAGGAKGTAIAPPPSLQENVEREAGRDAGINAYGSSSVAAKIMARYGFKDGQGLGKQEQGMSIALQVEKTSKRGGRIIHEKELKVETQMMPPTGFLMAKPQSAPIPGSITPLQQRGEQSEQSITEIIKSPSKVVLLRNMVGPGDVDQELEPEVKDECNTK